MGTWSNSNHGWYGDDMDSARNQPPEDHKLVVRNYGATPTGQYRTEILETNTHQALHVDGLSYLELQNEALIALAVKGRTTMGSWDTEHRPQPVLLAGGRTELQAYSDEEGQDPEYALQVTGRTSFARQDAQDLMAVKVDGDVRIKLGQTTFENTCAALRPQVGVTIGRPDITDIAQFQLLINGNRDDRPNPPPNPGGSDAPHVKIGWMDEEGHGNVVALRPKKLLLGSAPFVLGDSDIYRIKAKGSMRIEPENPANVALDVVGLVNATSVHSASLQTGNAMFSGAISAQGSISTQQNLLATAGVFSQGIVVGTGFVTTGGLTAGGQSVFNGGVDFNEKVAVSAEMEHGAPVKMKGNAIVMGGEGESEVKMIAGDKRFEFYIGDKMRFYIDGTGGHNA